MELQDRRDYTQADRAARTCWLGCPGLLYYLSARDAKLSFSPVPSTWPLPPRPYLTSPKVLRSSTPRSKCQFSQGAVCFVIIPKVKNIRHNFIPINPGLPQDFVAEEIKIISKKNLVN
ncbi:hypothetical protein TNCV_3416231 [Trichonephila clavipes]|nr:hypothetical protein TNCV_3416231 [Trichonephila clavipes]